MERLPLEGINPSDIAYSYLSKIYDSIITQEPYQAAILLSLSFAPRAYANVAKEIGGDVMESSLKRLQDLRYVERKKNEKGDSVTLTRLGRAVADSATLMLSALLLSPDYARFISKNERIPEDKRMQIENTVMPALKKRLKKMQKMNRKKEGMERLQYYQDILDTPRDG